jgi:hypothetical protein
MVCQCGGIGKGIKSKVGGELALSLQALFTYLCDLCAFECAISPLIFNMAATLGGSKKLTSLKENSTELRQGRRCNYGLRRLESLAAKELAIKRRGETTLAWQTWRRVLCLSFLVIGRCR